MSRSGDLQDTTQRTIPRVAVIGCGAAAKEFCLPVLAKYHNYRGAVIVVDKVASQAQAVAAQFGIQSHCTDFDELPFDVDAAIVTTPHHLHAEHAIHFLRHGKPVLVEKPLAMTTEEVTNMLDAAASGNTTLMVNNCRRLFPSYRRVQQLLHSGEYGEIEKVSIHDGSPFEWHSVSAFYLRNAKTARGVFLDRGAHTLDIVCWWLSGQPEVVDAKYDALGGAEALMNVELIHGNTPIELAFSRFYKLANCYTIKCERAQIDGRLFNSTTFTVRRNGRAETIVAGKPALYHEYAQQLMQNFIDVVQGRAAPLFTAKDVAPSISVIDQAYRQATLMELPWYDHDPNLALLRNEVEVHDP